MPKHPLLLLPLLLVAASCDPTAKCDTLTSWFEDRDVDGFGTDAVVEQTCGEGPAGYVEAGGDCDDRDAAVFPTPRRSAATERSTTAPEIRPR